MIRLDYQIASYVFKKKNWTYFVSYAQAGLVGNIGKFLEKSIKIPINACCWVSNQMGSSSLGTYFCGFEWVFASFNQLNEGVEMVIFHFSICSC